MHGSLGRGPEEVSHDFRGMQVKLLHTIGEALFLLTQRVDLGCGGYTLKCMANVL